MVGLLYLYRISTHRVENHDRDELDEGVQGHVLETAERRHQGRPTLPANITHRGHNETTIHRNR